MKTPKSVGKGYDFISTGHLLALGDYPDITAAFYNGEPNRTLERAQRYKHEWILDGLGFKHGHRILDIGSGWGPMLKSIRDRGGIETGLTVSKSQFNYCRKKGLNARLIDWKEADVSELGKFDGILSIGAFEHFCSPEEFLEGKQEEIYSAFFGFCHKTMKDDRWLFLQTMLWGENAPSYEEINSAIEPSNSPARIMNVLLGLSSWWPPSSMEQILETAEPYFEFVESKNGRKDYAKTFEEWYKRWEPALKSLRVKASFAKQRVTSGDFRNVYEIMREQLQGKYFQRAFEKSFLDHERMFFKKRKVK